MKTGLKIFGEKAKEIAQKDGRTIVTYEDAEEALRQIRAENERADKLIKAKTQHVIVNSLI